MKLTTVRAVVELILLKPVGDAVRAVKWEFRPPYDNDGIYIDFLENENDTFRSNGSAAKDGPRSQTSATD
ncbi:MAG: hypothetical protein R3D69_05070 [Xanthobacteraceae bacterium]